MVRSEGEIEPIPDSRGRITGAIEKPPTSYTPELVALLREEYESGKTAQAISKQYFLDRAAVLKHLRASGVKIRHQGLTPAQAARAAEMYQSGQTLAEVGAWFDVSPKTVSRYLRLRGEPIRPALVKAAPSI